VVLDWLLLVVVVNFPAQRFYIRRKYPEIPWYLWISRNMYAEPAQCQQLGTTVFRGRFFQIPWVSLPNFAAHHGRFSTYTV